VLNVHDVNDVRQTEIHTPEPFVPERGSFEIEIATEKLKKCKSLEFDQLPAELIHTEGNILRSVSHKFINCI
jgi:hypothetical protein